MNWNFAQQPGLELNKDYQINEDIKALVSIITPYFNGGHNILQTANSIFNQTFPYFEWIIVNDGSTNKKDIDILEEVSAKDKRIKLFHKENGGISTARNLGIHKSTTEIIIPLDADDLISPNYIECIYWALYCNPGASWCYTDVVGFGEENYLWKKRFDCGVMKKYNLLTCTAGIRRKDLLECQCYDEQYKQYNEDWTLWLKLMAKGKYPVHLSLYSFWYRRTSKGILTKVKTDKELKKKSAKIIKELGDKIKCEVRAKEYPVLNKSDTFQKPYKWSWDKSLNTDKKKVKILLLIPHMVMGGADLFNLDLVANLDKEVFDIGIISTMPHESYWKQKFEKHISDIFELPMFLEQKDYAAFIHYYIKTRDINIVFILNSYYGYYLAPWLKKEFPYLSIIDYVHMEEWYWRNGGYARTSSAVACVLDMTYTCNENLRRVLIKEFMRSPDKIKTIYIGVDENRFDPGNAQNGIVKKKFNIPKGSPVVLFPCRLHPQKRPFLMLQIAMKLKDKIPDIRFLVVGDGEEENQIKRQIKQLKIQKTVILAGRQEDLVPFYADSDITLICSIKEGLALTAYESLSMGVPVVSSDVGGQRELVDNTVGRILPLIQDEANDLTNYNYSQEEVIQFVDAIYEILKDRNSYVEICKNCVTRIRTQFSKKIMIDIITREFQNMVATAEYKLDISGYLSTLETIVDDYVALYNEYEQMHIYASKYSKAVSYIKDMITLRRSPFSVFSEVVGKRGNIYVAKMLQKVGLLK